MSLLEECPIKYKSYVLLKQNPFPSMHPACSSVVILCSRPGGVFLLFVLGKSLRGWESGWGWGRYRSKHTKRASKHRRVYFAEGSLESTSTIIRATCQSMVEQDAAEYPSRLVFVSLCKERHYYKPVRVWMGRIQKP